MYVGEITIQKYMVQCISREIFAPVNQGSCVVWSLVFLVGSPKTNWSQAKGQMKNGSNLTPGREEGGGGFCWLDFIVQLGGLQRTLKGCYWGSLIWDLNPCGVILQDFCVLWTNTLFEHKDAFKCTWYQSTLSWRSMIDFLIVSFVLVVCRMPWTVG